MFCPRLSILLPYRNAAPTLPACLDSVLTQSVEDFEMLAVDDGSTDESAFLTRHVAATDSRVRPVGNPGRGIVAALNAGLRQARGDIVVRMDADDLMRPGRLQAHLDHFSEEPRLALSATRVRGFPELHIKAGFREYLQWQNSVISPVDVADEIYVEAPFAHPSVAFRREAVVASGGYRNGPFPEDYELWLRLFHDGQLMAKLPRVLLDWRDSVDRLSRTDPRYSRDAFDRLRAGFLARDQRIRGGRRPLVFWGAGRRTRRRVDHLLRLGYSPDAWIDIDPRKIGNRVHGVPVLPPDALDCRKRPFVLVYVTNHGARPLIARDLKAMGYGRGKDFLMVG